MPAYECTICMEYFDAGHNIPTTFPCGHSCCLRHTLEMLLCHVCRAPLPEDGLTPNITLRDISVEFAEMAKNMRQMTLAMAAMAPAPVAAPLPEVIAELADEAEIVGDIGEIEGLHAPRIRVTNEEESPAVSETAVCQAKKPRKRSAKKKKAGAVTTGHRIQSLFFDLLFVDLQIDVLQTWLGVFDDDFVCSVSALDIACCNKALRPAFLFLISRPWTVPPRTAGFGCNLGIAMHGSYLRWLHSRQVPVPRFFCGANEIQDWRADMNSESFSLPFMEILELGLYQSANHVEALLRACPNLIGLMGHEGFPGSLWNIIVRFPHLQLKVLDIKESLRDENVVCVALEMFGPRLLELRMSYTTVTPRIGEVIRRCCKQLNSLTITLSALPMNRLLQLLGELRALTSITCRCFDEPVTPEDVYRILQLHPNWKALTMWGTQWDDEVAEVTVARILEQYEGLRTLCLGSWEINRDWKVLHLPITSNATPQALDSILNACRETTHLTITPSFCVDDSLEIMTRIGRALGTSLTEIEFLCHDGGQAMEPDVLALVCQCPNLKNLSGDLYLYTKEGLKQFRECCPKAKWDSY